MTWRIVAASSIGESHCLMDSPQCQDFFISEVRHLPDGTEVLLCLLADGAGSASQGLAGAEIACLAGVDLLWGHIVKAGSVAAISEDEIHGWLDGIRKLIAIKSEAMQMDLREFACTLLCLAVDADSAICMQIGDGAIVFNGDDKWTCVFSPDTGEYANTTRFVTDDDAAEHLRVKFVSPIPNRAALFSDGLQRLALKFEADTVSVHSPFFEPMFAVLDKTTSPDELERLSKELEVFLASARIGALTDDDRTLVLASRVSPTTE